MEKYLKKKNGDRKEQILTSYRTHEFLEHTIIRIIKWFVQLFSFFEIVLIMANPYRAAAVVKVRQLIIEDDDARDKLIALCIKDVSIAEAVAEDADITANQMILLLPTNPGEYSCLHLSL